jgi:hypothetical protein
MTEAGCSSSTGVVTVGAPARFATSASPVASITRRGRSPRARLRLDDDARDPIAVHHGCDEQAVEHRVYARLLGEAVGDNVEASESIS